MAMGLFLLMWVVMMAAMMLPAVVPVLVVAKRFLRVRRAGPAATPLMAAAYLLVWSALGLFAYTVFIAFQTLVPLGGVEAVRAGALVLLVAGVYQLTPLKRVCLRHCRSPLAVVMRHAERIVQTRSGAALVGLQHGLYCVGCCWALMVILLAVGMMSLVWMGVIAALIVLEKVHPRGELLSLLLGASLIAGGVALLAEPGLIATIS
ncbi:DUF2182 domain-containing protein [Pseudonocardia sp. H11422]|uniref:DUF2182 domain-containing protein n=1 Tax=Pseudonocardia sp. H11422 TaxID=2835866 RepID=UPI002028C8F0|nr:DUF2182 domain-containing protein [Pseudonocardia sp. H11422]